MHFSPEETHDSSSEQLDQHPENLVQLPPAKHPAANPFLVPPGSLDLRVVPLESVPLQPFHWLWPGKVPLARVTLLSGAPGPAPSCLAADLAARVTRGEGVPPDHGLPQPASVLYLAADSAAGQSIRPRMAAAGAELARIHLIHLLRDKGPIGIRPPPVSLADDLKHLAAALRDRPDVRLVVVDPVAPFLSGLDERNPTRLHALLAELTDLAARADAAVLLLSSAPRPLGPAALLRSIAAAPLFAAVHTVLAVVDDPHVVGRRLLLPLKVDPLGDDAVRAFNIRDGRLVWTRAAAEWTVDDLLSPRGGQLDDEDATQRAVDWLDERLADGPVGIRAVRREARERRIPRRILLRARRALGVELVHDGHQARWFYQLPADPDPPNSPAHSVPLSDEQREFEEWRRLDELQLRELRLLERKQA